MAAPTETEAELVQQQVVATSVKAGLRMAEDKI